jgi:hypothetical protein
MSTMAVAMSLVKYFWVTVFEGYWPARSVRAGRDVPSPMR